MGLGIRRRVRKIKIQVCLLFGQIIYLFEGIGGVAVFLRRLNRECTKAVLRRFGASIGENCDIESGIIVHNADKSFSNLKIGDYSHIGKNVFLDLRETITIHEGSTISMCSIILSHTDAGNAGPFDEKYAKSAMPVEIGPRSYLGAGAIILPGVKIRERTIVAAGSVVNKKVAAGILVAGTPAKVIRKL